MPSLEFEMTYRPRVRGSMPSTKGSPRGERIYWSEATLDGARIKARTEVPGGDWYAAGPDRYGRPDVRLQFVTEDGAVILLRYTGLVEMNEAFTAAAGSGNPTQFEDSYIHMAMSFDTGAAKYAWLNQHLFIAEGRLSGKEQLEYRVYRVT